MTRLVRHAVFSALIVGSASAGCSGSDGGPAEFTRTDSAGIAIVENHSADRPLSVSLQTDYVLGGEDEGPESFYRLYPRWISVGSDGRIAVLNQEQYQASVFDADGRHLTTFGRRGEGPGEFSYPSGVIALPDGEVGVFDFQKQGFELFDSMGGYLGHEAAGVPFNGLGMVAADDGLFLLSLDAPRRGGVSTVQVVFVSETDTVSIGPAIQSPSKPVYYESCRVTMTLPPLFSYDLAWSSTGSETAVVGGPSYSIELYEDTELVSIVRRDMVVQQATDELAKRVLGEGEEWGVGGETCIVPPEEVIEQRDVAEYIPLILDVTLSPQNQIWVKRRAEDLVGEKIDVFDGSGAYLGTAPEGTPFPVTFLPDGRAITFETDALDVQRLVVSTVEIGAED